MRYLLLFFIVPLLYSCKSDYSETVHFSAGNEDFTYSGRIRHSDDEVILINSGAAVKMKVIGDSITLHLKTGNEHHQYASIELDEEYLGRFKIEQDSLQLDLPNDGREHFLSIYKDTEASNGTIIFRGISAKKLAPVEQEEKPLIEFIGNSITCGMGADTRDISCDEGEWFDQHNAYLAYGPRVARALDANFELSCVSGMGMYRNWNDEDQPVMPDVYSNLYLNNDNSLKKSRTTKAPEVVSIALGTNDLSLGDGIKERGAFDAEKFTSSYINFVEEIINQYPQATIALLSSPMVGEQEKVFLNKALQAIKQHFDDRTVHVFTFTEITPNGCGYHPDIYDHEEMSEQLIPFFKNLLNHN